MRQEGRELSGESAGAPDVAEEIVAYLDGELSAEARAAVEQRLAEDANYRDSLVQLQQVWQWLDRLPLTDADPGFTRNTLAMVAVDTQAAAPTLAGTKSALRAWAPLIGAAVVLAAMAFAAIYVPSYWRYQSELSDLPVAHNLEVYRYAESLEFVRQLDAQGLFPEDVPDEP